jgi:hypothetical protein
LPSNWLLAVVMDTRSNERLNRQQLKPEFPQISHPDNSEYSSAIATRFSAYTQV